MASLDAQIRINIPLHLHPRTGGVTNQSADDTTIQNSRNAKRIPSRETKEAVYEGRSVRVAEKAVGRASYATGASSDFFGAAGPIINKVPGRSLAYSYASQGYFIRAAVCVTHGDGTDKDIAEGKAAYKQAGAVKLTPMGKRLLEGVKYVPRRNAECPICNGSGNDWGSPCWKCGGSGVVKQSQGWNAILGLD